MPGSADVSGLNVQFGALDFGSEAGGTVDMGQTESAREQAPAPAAPAPILVPTQQPQSSLFSKPGPMRYVKFCEVQNYLLFKEMYFVQVDICVKQVRNCSARYLCKHSRLL